MSAVITAAQLQALCPHLPGPVAQVHAQALEAARPLGEIGTGRRAAQFMAQVLTETGALVRLKESLAYKDPKRLDELFSAVKGEADAKALIAAGEVAIANRVYANRIGNGDEASGDGWRFRGRGYLQITGRDNYRAFGARVGMDLEGNPQLLEQPGPAAEASAKYWAANHINVEADAGDVVGVTRKINVGLAGLDQRRAWLAKTSKVWS